MQTVQAIGRRDLSKILYEKNLQHTLIVDSYNGAALNMEIFRPFNPFHRWQDPLFPVPGMSGQFSHSIEAIWQGTKLVKGVLDTSQFLKMPFKRPSELERKGDPFFNYAATEFQYENKIISHKEARFLIYFTSYLFLLNEVICQSLFQLITDKINQGKNILFCDWDENFDILDTSESFSHSAIIAAWFNGTVEKDFLEKGAQVLAKENYVTFLKKCQHLLTRYKKYHRGG